MIGASRSARPLTIVKPSFTPTPVRDRLELGARKRPLSQSATRLCGILSFGTRVERIAPESLLGRCFHLFTARCRLRARTRHDIQNDRNEAQQAADDKTVNPSFQFDV
jgi:hypothetical protein